MKAITKAVATQQFDKQLFRSSPLFITCDHSWDGGITEDSSLCEKALFYGLADRMSSIIKDIAAALGENPLVGKALCENEVMFAHWSDLEDNALYRQLTDRFRKNKYYELSLPADGHAVDLAVEANFMYLSHITFYLPKSKMALVPTCHTEILVFCPDKQKHLDTLHRATQKFSNPIFQIQVVE